MSVKHHCTEHTSDIVKPLEQNLWLYWTSPATPSTSIVVEWAAINADVLDFICFSAYFILFL